MESVHTGDDCIASKIVSKIGLTNDTGGMTPHIRNRRVLPRKARSSLSFTREDFKIRSLFSFVYPTFCETE